MGTITAKSDPEVVERLKQHQKSSSSSTYTVLINSDNLVVYQQANEPQQAQVGHIWIQE
jgi:hypothetical protein